MFLWDFLRKSRTASTSAPVPVTVPKAEKKAVPRLTPTVDIDKQETLAILLAMPTSEQRDAALLAFTLTAAAGLRIKAAAAIQGAKTLESLAKAFVDKDRRVYKLAKERLSELNKADKKNTDLTALTAQYQAAYDAEVTEVTRLVEADHVMEELKKHYGLSAQEQAALEALRIRIQQKLIAQTDSQRQWVQVREQLTTLKKQALALETDAVLEQLAEILAHASSFVPSPASKKISAQIDALATEIQHGIRIRVDHEEKISARLALIEKVLTFNPQKLGQQELDNFQAQWRALPPVEGTAIELAERFSAGLKKAKEALLAAHALTQEKAKLAQAFFQTATTELQAALAQGHALEAIKLYGQVKQRSEELRFCPAALTHRLAALMEEAGKLKGWQSFTNVNKRDELIERAEKIATTPLPPPLQETEIKSLQEQWQTLDKKLGTASEKLWKRFKAAIDKAYEPVREFRKSMAKIRDHNAAAKKDQIRQLTDLLAQVDWNSVDWKAVEQLRREARVAWKQAGPTNRKVQESLSQEHSTIMKQLDDHLNTARTKETARRAGLIAQANALLNKPVPEALAAVRVLQERWTSERVGVFLGRKQEDETWQAFRTASNAVFALREQKRNELLGELEANFTAKQELIGKLQALSTLEDSKLVEVQLKQHCVQWDAIGRVPQNKSLAQLDQWRDIQNSIKTHLQNLKQGQQALDLQTAHAQDIAKRINVTPEQQEAKQAALLDLEIAAQVDSPAQVKDDRLKRQVFLLAKSFHGERTTSSSSLTEKVLAWHALPGGDDAMDARLAKILEKIQ